MPNRQQVIHVFRFTLLIYHSFSTLRIHIHLAFVAGKLEAELPAVAQTKEERFLPRGLAPSPLHTITQRITQTVAALHQQNLLLALCPVA